MARCSRCGASFNYEKRDGICPKCCFYNRPEGSASVDNSWMSKYGVDETGYEAPRFQSEHDDWEAENEKERARFGGDLLVYMNMKKKKADECQTEGSHVHVDRPIKRMKKEPVRTTNKTDNKPNSKFTIISVIAIVYILIAFVTILLEMLSF